MFLGVRLLHLPAEMVKLFGDLLDPGLQLLGPLDSLFRVSFPREQPVFALVTLGIESVAAGNQVAPPAHADRPARLPRRRAAEFEVVVVQRAPGPPCPTRAWRNRRYQFRHRGGCGPDAGLELRVQGPIFRPKTGLARA